MYHANIQIYYLNRILLPRSAMQREEDVEAHEEPSNKKARVTFTPGRGQSSGTPRRKNLHAACKKLPLVQGQSPRVTVGYTIHALQ